MASGVNGKRRRRADQGEDWRGLKGLLTGRRGGRRMDESGWSRGVTGRGTSGARIRVVRTGGRRCGMGCGRNVRGWVGTGRHEGGSDGMKM